jgi:ABC-type lipoprotein release transport system permease subunit
VPLFLLALTTAAALRPAWRASTIDPIRTIRSS